METLTKLLLGFYVAVVVLASYEGQQVLRCQIENSVQAKLVESLQDELDFWAIRGSYVDVRVISHEQSSKSISAMLNCEVMIADLEKHVQESYTPTPPSAADPFYSKYPTYDEIKQRVSNLSIQYPSLAKAGNLPGLSVENRTLPLLIVTGNKTSTPKWTIYLEGGIHAREWIAPITVLYIAENLLLNYGVDSSVTKLLDRIEFHIAPEVNPDGYVYTWTGSDQRLWRKNRRFNNPSYGVDLNRNFNDHWGGTGSSGVPSSDTYRGPSVASEPETKAVQNYNLGLPKRLGAIDYHSYGELILRSWGWTVTPGPDESWLKPLGDNWSAAMAAVHGVKYTSERAAELYPATGCTDDWLTTEAANPGHGWTVELRNTNTFLLPPAQITPTGEENFAGLVYWAQQLLSRFDTQ